ncbi:MAG: DUF1464 family protein [Sulfolobales archaeon]
MRVLAIDPGSITTSVATVENDKIYRYREVSSKELSRNPEMLFEMIEEDQPDIIVAPSGYGLPPVDIRELNTEERLKSLLLREDDPGIEDLKYISYFLKHVERIKVPVIGVPGIYNLATIDPSKRINRIDLGTADKTATAILAIYVHSRGDLERLSRSNIIVMELGAFTSGIAVKEGRIIDGVGGTLYPIGLISGGGWDGEIAVILGRRIYKRDLFKGGLKSICGTIDLEEIYVRCREGFERYIDDIAKTIAVLERSIRRGGLKEDEIKIYLSGRGARNIVVKALKEYGYNPEILPRFFKGSDEKIKSSAEGSALYGILWKNNRDFLRRIGVLEDWIPYDMKLIYY